LSPVFFPSDCYDCPCLFFHFSVAAVFGCHLLHATPSPCFSSIRSHMT
jgi:hypothetical protein